MPIRKTGEKTPKIPQLPSNLEALFWLQLRVNGIQSLFTQQFQAVPDRKFRFDFACQSRRFLVEIQGGTYSGGAHSRPLGLARDYEKCNLAQRHGWKIYQFDKFAVEDGSAVNWVIEELGVDR